MPPLSLLLCHLAFWFGRLARDLPWRRGMVSGSCLNEHFPGDGIAVQRAGEGCGYDCSLGESGLVTSLKRHLISLNYAVRDGDWSVGLEDRARQGRALKL